MELKTLTDFGSLGQAFTRVGHRNSAQISCGRTEARQIRARAHLHV